MYRHTNLVRLRSSCGHLPLIIINRYIMTFMKVQFPNLANESYKTTMVSRERERERESAEKLHLISLDD
jgi:hypothetical protein